MYTRENADAFEAFKMIVFAESDFASLLCCAQQGGCHPLRREERLAVRDSGAARCQPARQQHHQGRRQVWGACEAGAGADAATPAPLAAESAFAANLSLSSVNEAGAQKCNSSADGQRPLCSCSHAAPTTAQYGDNFSVKRKGMPIWPPP